MHKSLLVLLAILLAGSCASDQVHKTGSPQSAAEAFLSLIDEGNYQQSWTEASSWIRTHLDAAQWEAHVGNYRRPLGKVSSRSLSTVEFHDSLEEMPSGSYAFVFFDSVREGNRTAKEMVGLMLEEDSSWRVIGYQIL